MGFKLFYGIKHPKRRIFPTTNSSPKAVFLIIQNYIKKFILFIDIPLIACIIKYVVCLATLNFEFIFIKEVSNENR